MKFTIITPSLQRQSLRKTCSSIDEQSFQDFEHIVQIDCEDLDAGMMFSLAHPNRRFFQCDHPHKNGGNTCRRMALEKAKGNWIYFLDDDNYLADSKVLEDIAFALPQNYAWALFPINRLGSRFYTDPPRSCHVDTLNVMLRRDIARWPDTDAYGTDGILVDGLMAEGIPYAPFPDFRPIAVLPKISFCKEDA